MSPQQSRSLIGAFHVFDPDLSEFAENWTKPCFICESVTGAGQAKPVPHLEVEEIPATL